jgi:metal-sulfur cluster biosynthetic enzyme
MRDPNDIKEDDIPTTPEELAAWEAKYGSKAKNGDSICDHSGGSDIPPPVGGVDTRFEQSDEACIRPEGAEDDPEMVEKVIEQLKTIYDPELPVNIYDLGLIYDVECWKHPVTKQSECKVVMTLTSPTCSMSGVITDLVRSIPARLDGLDAMDVQVVFDPPWSQDKMSDEAKLAMGML